MPIELTTARDLCPLLDALPIYIGAITIKLRVVLQLAPGDRVRVGPNGKKSVERRDGVDDLAAHLLDLQALDRPDAAPISSINSDALHPITANVRVSRRP